MIFLNKEIKKSSKAAKRIIKGGSESISENVMDLTKSDKPFLGFVEYKGLILGVISSLILLILILLGMENWSPRPGYERCMWEMGNRSYCNKYHEDYVNY